MGGFRQGGRGGKWVDEWTQKWTRKWTNWLGILIGLGFLVLGLTSCTLPQVSAEERLFLDLSVEAVDHWVLPMDEFEGTRVGGLSAIAYDRNRSRFYALSDDRQRPRFYTLNLDLSPTGINNITVEAVTELTDRDGNSMAPLDGEGLVLTPSNSLIVSSEGSPRQQVPPRLQEFELETGRLKTDFRVPDRYLLAQATGDPATGDPAPAGQTQGIQENIGFEALTISAPGGSYEPFRLFAATEGPLYQDLDLDPEIPFKNRWLHYLIDPNQTVLISEHFYAMDAAPLGALVNGLSEILSIDGGGHFLALERAFGLQGMAIKLYQLAMGVASDVGAIATLQGDTSGITPIRKQLVADLTPLAPDNLEAMTLGPRLGDGSQSLILVSDNNFDQRQETQVWLFKLKGL
ncbi:esterase-like activity of phytase family protein [Leptothoe sp. PORK10 BA2]|uniref:esterase-like activity of phytase family protein n=1 Tax=Leptothoe sp. PORK10 BA2 TaxID=3110254 RepID=UPI002B2170C7|nr:esterase-like activity of phytase family protein [Leptothoe sp. PORK10 BA2]MEA5462590.1 esterase-like activity of phytase family protein [Leptothoe sp. PORK10 BA2]